MSIGPPGVIMQWSQFNEDGECKKKINLDNGRERSLLGILHVFIITNLHESRVKIFEK